jgi:hypothetical protein
MATTKPRSNRTGVGCLMLFALPFAAVGIGALGWAGWTLLEWQRIARWQPVSAEVVSAALEEHDGDDSTTYEATATYRYDYAGQTYTGTRVAIDFGADNFGDFQRRVYRQLRTAHERGTPVTAYVDPSSPGNAVLNRELRPGLLAFKGLFGLIFGAVGFGLMIGARYGAKKMAAEQALREQFPDEPWRWRPEWANGRITGSAQGAAYVSIGFAVVWNLVSVPMLVLVPEEIASGNTAAAVGFLFPLIGLGLAAWAIRAWLRLKRFKLATLTLDRLPVALGGRLKGTIRVEAAVPVTADFALELACSEERTSGSGKNRRRTERLLWQKQWRVPRHQCQIGHAFTTVPVDVAVPADQAATSVDDGADEIKWRLDVTGECAGPDFWSRFELPVFATGEQASPSEATSLFSPPQSQRPDARTLDALGIDYERLPQGGEAWTFRRARHKGVAAGVSLFAAIWTAACAFMLAVGAPVVLPIVFGLFDLLFVWWAISLWLTERRVTLDRGVLTLSRRGLLAGTPVEIPQQWIRAVRAKRGMQAGNKLYYDLRVDTAEGSHTAASSLPDYDVASWFARYWMGDGARAQQ